MKIQVIGYNLMQRLNIGFDIDYTTLALKEILSSKIGLLTEKDF